MQLNESREEGNDARCAVAPSDGWRKYRPKEKQKGGQLTVRDLLVRASRVGEFREVTWPLRASYLCEDLGGRGGSGRSA